MDNATTSKVCTRCGETKRLDEFYVRRASSDGRAASCADCNRAAVAGHRTRNPEKIAEARRRWSEKNPLYASSNAKRWRARSPEKKREYAKAYDALNADKVAERKRRWYLANRDELLARTDVEKKRAAAKKYAELHPRRRAESQRRRMAAKRGNTVGVVDVQALWTGSCTLCGEPIDQLLSGRHPLMASLDHIVPISKGGAHSQGNLQWTHLRCNIRKGARSTRSGRAGTTGGQVAHGVPVSESDAGND